MVIFYFMVERYGFFCQNNEQNVLQYYSRLDKVNFVEWQIAKVVSTDVILIGDIPSFSIIFIFCKENSEDKSSRKMSQKT